MASASTRGGRAVNALASRSKFAQNGVVLKLTSQLVGLWLAGVRIPSPAPICQSELDSKPVRIKKFDFALWMGGQSARATMKNSLIRRESPMQINGTFNID